MLQTILNIVAYQESFSYEEERVKHRQDCRIAVQNVGVQCEFVRAKVDWKLLERQMLFTKLDSALRPYLPDDTDPAIS